MRVRQSIFSTTVMVLVLVLLTGCANMTPRYKFSDELSNINESNAALLQIPTNTAVYSCDEIAASFSVKNFFNSQAIVNHHYRETLIPLGLHVIMYSHNRSYSYYSAVDRAEVMASQAEPFVTAIEFKKGHTYRIQTYPRIENGKYVFHGWVEELPFFMARRKIKPGPNFNKQFEYWYKQEWQVAGAGLPAKRFKDMNIHELQSASIAGINDLRAKYSHLK